VGTGAGFTISSGYCCAPIGAHPIPGPCIDDASTAFLPLAYGLLMTKGPLRGVRVLEMTRGIPGRSAGMLLADFGAEVARVVGQDLPRRSWDPGQLCWDRGKLLVVLDTTGTDATTEARRLVEAADVVIVDDARAGLERRGLDASTLLSRDADLIHAWFPPYGARGRWAQLPDDPLFLAAVGGFADHHPAAEDRPVAPVIPMLQYLQGALGAGAVAAALLGRASDGRGRAVTVTGLHASAAALLPIMTEGLDHQVVSVGRSLRGAPNFRIYRAGDGAWFVLAALTADFFFRALDAVGRMDVLVRQDVAGDFGNLRTPDVAEAVGAELELTFATRPREEWLQRLSAAGIPAAPVSSREEWMASDIIAANHARIDIEHPEVGLVTMPGMFIDLSDVPGRVHHLPSDEYVVPAQSLWTEPARTRPPHRRIDDVAPLPLAGLKVIDLCTFLAGPFTTSVLADHGADVIKVESITGDPYGTFSVAHTVVNQRKRIIALDLRQPGGRAAFLELIRQADVLVDNLRPASLERLEMGDDVLSAANSRLVRCSVSAYGHTGPAANLPGFDPVVQARSGAAVAQGGRGDPVSTAAPVHDIATGALAAYGILLALLVREQSGRSPRVRASLAATSTFLQSAELTTFPGRPPPLVGGLDFPGPGVNHRYYQARDGWLAVMAPNAATKAQLLRVVRHPEWAGLDDDELEGRMEATFNLGSVTAWLDELSAAGVPACQVLRRAGELDDPFLVDNQFSHVLRHPLFGRVRIVRGYSHWRAIDSRRPSRPAIHGTDTRAVLVEAGIAPGDVDLLVETGAAGVA
jgi:crotonobetainyl-CoA:carnitine CoA-transferase CaiB-like acyl-CoA transferase